MSDKRRELIETALDLFYQQGIHAVGINAVLEQSGIAKKTLYHHFKSKEDLLLAALAHRHKVFFDWLLGEIPAESTGVEAITALFKCWDKWLNSSARELGMFSGCFFINTRAEYHSDDSPIAKMCLQHKQALISLIADKIGGEKQELVYPVYLLLEGAIVSAHVNGDKSAAIKCLSLVDAMF